MKIGFHVSIVGTIDRAVDRAVELGCNTFQIFTRNPRHWKAKNITLKEGRAFKEKVLHCHMKPVFSHMPYLPNLASPDNSVYLKSVECLTTELDRCKMLQIPYVVTHLGSHRGAGMEKGFTRIINAINEVFRIVDWDGMVLLENMAGTKNSMGSSFEDIQYIIERLLFPEHIGICFDTSHAFTAGYDLRSQRALERTLRKFEEVIGFEKLKLVHLNDSIGYLDSHIDRHEHIGMGKIGEEGFRNILKSQLSKYPLILETPKDARRSDIENLKKIKELASDA